MKVPPAHRTLLATAGVAAVGGAVFAHFMGTGPEAIANTTGAAILLGAAILTRIGGRAWLISTVGAIGGMLAAILTGLHDVRLALSWLAVDDPSARLVASSVALVVAAACIAGAIAVWRDLPRTPASTTGASDRAVAFRAHGRRFATGTGMTLIALGFCAIKSTVLPTQALASLSDPAASPLLHDPAVQQVITDPRVLYRLRHEPDFRRNVLRLGVPPELVRFALEMAEEQFGSLPEVPIHPPKVRRDPTSSGALPTAAGMIQTRSAAGPLPAPRSEPDMADEPAPVVASALSPAPPVSPPSRVHVPDLTPVAAHASATPTPDAEPPTALPNTDTASAAPDEPLVLITTLLMEAAPGETLVEATTRHADLGGTIAMGVGGLLVLIAVVQGWIPARRDAAPVRSVHATD